MIGLIDSGIGGLSIFNEVRKQLPQEDLIYFSDYKNFPYGVKTFEEIEKIITRICDFLFKKGVEIIVIACNTITVSTIKTLREKYTDLFVGVEPPIKPALVSGFENIVILATNTTSKTQRYKELIETYKKNNSNVTSFCDPRLTKLIEEEFDNINSSDEKLKEILNPIIDKKFDSIVIGCTHYVFIEDNLKRIFGENISIFDPCIPVTKQLIKRLKNIKSNPTGSSKNEFFTSKDLEKFKKQVSSFTGIQNALIDLADLEKF